MADRSSHRHSNASDSDSQHTFCAAQNAPSTLPKPPAPVHHRQNGELSEKSEAGVDQDLEKQAAMSPRISPDMTERYNPYFGRTPYNQSRSSMASEDDHLVDQGQHLEPKAIKILLFLSGPCVFLSGLLCIWALVVSLFTVLTYPLRLFSSRRHPLGDELCSLLARSNRLQLRAIYSYAAKQGRSFLGLLLVHLLSPFLAVAVALGAWAVAIYWIFAAMIGDPDGTEGGNDGRATVLGLRAYWEIWLCKAMDQ